MKRFLPIIITAALLVSCSNDELNVINPDGPDSEVPVVIEFTPQEKSAAKSMSDFNTKFLYAVCKSNQGGNVVVSPVSAAILLSMLSNAAEPEVSTEIANALGCSDMETLNSYCSKTLSIFPSADNSTEVAFANSVWYRDIYTINPVLSKTMTDIYKAPCFARDFSQSTLVGEINNWVKDNSKGWIDEIIGTIPEETAAITINTLYFKGLWANPFDIKETAKAIFNGKSGKNSVDMMHNSNLQHYTEGKNYQAVKMEFGEGVYEAILILPDENIAPTELLTPETIDNIGKPRYIDCKVNLYYPKFKLDRQPKTDLRTPLESLGITKIFGTNEFSLFTEKMSLENKIFQKNAIEFTETGAEGASVTWSQEVTLPGSGAEETPEMKFDRPFIFLIRHAETGACLFGGLINEL